MQKYARELFAAQQALWEKHNYRRPMLEQYEKQVPALRMRPSARVDRDSTLRGAGTPTARALTTLCPPTPRLHLQELPNGSIKYGSSVYVYNRQKGRTLSIYCALPRLSEVAQLSAKFMFQCNDFPFDELDVVIEVVKQLKAFCGWRALMQASAPLLELRAPEVEGGAQGGAPSKRRKR